MANQRAGSSGTKRAKYDLNVSKKLADEELEELLNSSDNEEIFGSEVEGDMSENNNSSDVNSDDEPLAKLVSTQDSAKVGLDWTDDLTSIRKVPFTKRQQPQGNDPIDYFNLIVDQNLLELIVEQTNLYAIEVLCLEGKSEKSRIAKW